MSICVYPGSFDPPTMGHIDVIRRASKMFDVVHILVSDNPAKKPLFSASEREELIKKCTEDLKNVIVSKSSGLVVDYCKSNNINVIVRGTRNIQDYENEFMLYQFNKDICPEIDTVLLFPSTKTQAVSSSAIKELVKFNVDISKYVHKNILEIVINKIKEPKL